MAIGDDGSRNNEPGEGTEEPEVDGSLAVYPAAAPHRSHPGCRRGPRARTHSSDPADTSVPTRTATAATASFSSRTRASSSSTARSGPLSCAKGPRRRTAGRRLRTSCTPSPPGPPTSTVTARTS
ncbi:hypothetical protein NKH18_09500 [Streptomyces sp. M10(2022)]